MTNELVRTPPTPKPFPTNLYEILGCEPTATVEQLRKAYREKSSLWHPDKTNRETYAEFNRVCEAWAVLGNAKARQEYDALGVERAPSVDDPIEQKARDGLAQLITQVMNDDSDDPDTTDVLMKIRRGVEGMRVNLVSAQAELKKREHRVGKLIKRMKQISGAKRPPLLLSIMEDKMKQIRIKRLDLNESFEVHARVVLLLSEYTYEYDRPAPMGMSQSSWTVTRY